jgi:hypothetical protein
MVTDISVAEGAGAGALLSEKAVLQVLNVLPRIQSKQCLAFGQNNCFASGQSTALRSDKTIALHSVKTIALHSVKAVSQIRSGMG